MKLLVVLIICILIKGSNCIDSEITPQCKASEKICRVTWTLTQFHTMTLYENGTGFPIVYKDGHFRKMKPCDEVKPEHQEYEIATQEELKKVNMADGLQKFVYGINNKMPGPTLVVYENQTVEVKVINNFIQEGTGIHWHGLFQKGTPWMDGVSSVSQCTINIRETFVYRFKPEPYGTMWYHSHTGVQRTDGLFGGFIILPKDPSNSFHKDFIFLFHEWRPLRNDIDLYGDKYSLTKYLYYGYDESKCDHSIHVSILINGRGRLYHQDKSAIPVPLTRYSVIQGNKYRFRFLNAGLKTPYRVRIDKHKMVLLATDGSHAKPVTTDYIIVHIGERYDVSVEANQDRKNYYIRVEKLDSTQHPGLAILSYEGADSSSVYQPPQDPCNEANCTVINCPSRDYPQSEENQGLHYSCCNVGSCVKSDNRYSYFEVDHHAQDIEEHFLVFSFTRGIDNAFRASINARHFVVPSAPPQVYQRVKNQDLCDNKTCDEGPCQCTHMIKVTKGKTIQMVFASAGGDNGHPIHVHGHSYQVVKVVYGKKRGRVHPDIDCNSKQPNRCTEPSWKKGFYPLIDSISPPEKDVVIVPNGGYVIIRFTAKNPGWWMLHCHIDFHIATGMGLIMQEGEDSDMPVPPSGFPTCGSFEYEDMLSIEDTRVNNDPGAKSNSNIGYIVGIVIAFIAGCAVVAVIIWLIKKFQVHHVYRAADTEETELETKASSEAKS